MWRGYNYTHTHRTQLLGPQGHFTSDRSHCKEAAACTTCQCIPTHIIVSQYKSFMLHMLRGRYLGIEENKLKCQSTCIINMCAEMYFLIKRNMWHDFEHQ